MLLLLPASLGAAVLVALEPARPGASNAAVGVLLRCVPPCKAMRCMCWRELRARVCAETAAAATVAAAAEGVKAKTAVITAWVENVGAVMRCSLCWERASMRLRSITRCANASKELPGCR